MLLRPTTTKPNLPPILTSKEYKSLQEKYQQPVQLQSVYNPPKSRKLSILND